MKTILAVCVVGLLSLAASVDAQSGGNSGTVRGSVLDSSSAAVAVTLILKVSSETTVVTVTTEAGDLLETVPTTHTVKTSVVIVVTTRSGLGVKPARGDITASYGSFGTSNEGLDVAFGSNRPSMW